MLTRFVGASNSINRFYCYFGTRWKVLMQIFIPSNHILHPHATHAHKHTWKKNCLFMVKWILIKANQQMNGWKDEIKKKHMTNLTSQAWHNNRKYNVLFGILNSIHLIAGSFNRPIFFVYVSAFCSFYMVKHYDANCWHDEKKNTNSNEFMRQDVLLAE